MYDDVCGGADDDYSRDTLNSYSYKPMTVKLLSVLNLM